jgi:4-hydroxy-tetrahydrodipicolinate synthase
MLPETVARLAELPEVVAIKEASGNPGQMAEIVKLAGDKITLLAGDDIVTLPVLALGGKGVVSVVANIAPRETADMVDAWADGNIEKSREIYYRLLPLFLAMFYETNPIPVKTSLALMGKIRDEMRLPLCPLAPANLERLKKALKDFGLITGD